MSEEDPTSGKAEDLTPKEAMEQVRAINEVMTLFKTSGDQMVTLFPDFEKAAEGDGTAWFNGMWKVSELDLDEAHGCLIVALTVLAKVKVGTRDTVAEQIVKDLFKAKGVS